MNISRIPVFSDFLAASIINLNAILALSSRPVAMAIL